MGADELKPKEAKNIFKGSGGSRLVSHVYFRLHLVLIAGRGHGGALLEGIICTAHLSYLKLFSSAEDTVGCLTCLYPVFVPDFRTASK